MVGALVLCGCAHTALEPLVVDAITADEHLGKYTHLLISTQVEPGVFIPDHEKAGVVAGVKRELQARAPGRFTFVDEQAARTPSIPAAARVAAPETLHMRIVFTRYDEGNAFARFMFAGLGQMHLDTEVVLIDFATDEVLGEYEVSKQFAFGGIYGGATDMEDVEQGLAKGIANILVPSPTT